jgi:hypothetical protein
MKTIENILDFENRTADDIISDLKKKQIRIPEWSTLEKDYDPHKHAIVADPTLRPNDKVKKGKRELVAKLTYPAEKINARKITQMCFTIPVKREYQTTDDEQLKAFQQAIEEVYAANRIDGVNIKRFKSYFAACEMCSIWYSVDTGKIHNSYGFPTPYKFRCKSYSSMPESMSGIPQADLYPLKDEFDDMIAFSIEYSVRFQETTIKHFECYTADAAYYWIDEGQGYVMQEPEQVPIGKIQVSYIYRNAPCYQDVANNRNEIEFTMSRSSDIIRKNSKPIVKLVGNLTGEAPVGDEAREVYKMEQGGDLGLIAPAFDVTASSAHIDELKKNIEEITQMPNLSLENIKGLTGVVSGEARKTLLTDAHMKVGEEKHEICWFLDREFSIIKSLVALANVKWKPYIDKSKCTHIVTPFVQNDEASEINNRTKANGGQPIESQLESIKRFGRSDDAEITLSQIQEEQRVSAEVNRMENVFTGAE